MAGLSESEDLGFSSGSDQAASVENPEDADDTELREYGRSLGIDLANDDADLVEVARQAFNAALPPGWIEYADDLGRVYFYNLVTQESNWSHPLDSAYREAVQLVKQLRAMRPPASEARRAEAIQAHLDAVHVRAKAKLEGWSGPYASESGQYFYNTSLGVSSWESPVDEWQSELTIRQNVLHTCLFPEGFSAPAVAASSGLDFALAPMPELPKLPLQAPRPARPESPAVSAREFFTPRSARSARSLTPTHARGRTSQESSARPACPSSPVARSPATRSPAGQATKGALPAQAVRQVSPDTEAEACECSPPLPQGSPGPPSAQDPLPPQAPEGPAEEDPLEYTFSTGDKLALPKFGA